MGSFVGASVGAPVGTRVGSRVGRSTHAPQVFKPTAAHILPIPQPHSLAVQSASLQKQKPPSASAAQSSFSVGVQPKAKVGCELGCAVGASVGSAVGA